MPKNEFSNMLLDVAAGGIGDYHAQSKTIKRFNVLPSFNALAIHKMALVLVRIDGIRSLGIPSFQFGHDLPATARQQPLQANGGENPKIGRVVIAFAQGQKIGAAVPLRCSALHASRAPRAC